MADELQARPAPDPAAIPDLLATAILVVDARSEIAWLNQAAAALLATSQAAARGRRLATLLADAAAIDALLARSRESHEPLAVRGIPLVPAARADMRYQADVHPDAARRPRCRAACWSRSPTRPSPRA